MTSESASPAKPASAKRRLPLRFSLRVLLLAVTAIAIGFAVWFPVWYVAPYEEEVVIFSSDDPKHVFKDVREITTWQRHWGKGRTKEGQHRKIFNGVIGSISTYRNSKLDGPYTKFSLKGTLAEKGQYLDNQKNGVWISYYEDGSERSTTSWSKERLHGPATIHVPNGKHEVVFATGKVIEVDGKPVEDRLATMAEAGKINSPKMIERLGWSINDDYIGQPLSMAMKNLSEGREVPIFVDRRYVDPDLRVGVVSKDIPLAGFLAILSAVHHLGCDYRYGCIWITSAQEARDWHDPTGIAEITPPEGFPLAAAWSEPTWVEATNEPLSQVLTNLTAPREIAVDISRIAPAGEGAAEFLVTQTLDGLPFQCVLGILLDQTRCRCKLEGETLVILLPGEQSQE